MITKTELASRALKKLSVYQANETLSDTDQALVFDSYDSIYEELSEDGFVAWPNTGSNVEEIPERFVRPLVDVLAFDLAPYFGKALEQRAALAEAAARKIRHLTTNRWVPQVTPTEFT